jgi:hypothetical protein
VHEPGDELVVRRVLVVLDSLEEGVGAVADADERYADAVVHRRLTILLAVLLGHWVLLDIAYLLWGDYSRPAMMV